MFITLTNSSPQFKGQPVVLNKNFIVSVYKGEMQRPDDVVEKMTLVFCPPHGTWEVVESVEHVVSLLNA
jgi:hypothetical protein